MDFFLMINTHGEDFQSVCMGYVPCLHTQPDYVHLLNSFYPFWDLVQNKYCHLNITTCVFKCIWQSESYKDSREIPSYDYL